MRADLRRSSQIEVRDGLILVTANNTGNVYQFDYSEKLMNELGDKAWYEDQFGHLRRNVKVRQHGVRRCFALFAHHLVLPKRVGFDVDHVNRDPRDNRKCNLRYLRHADNIFNARLRPENRSGHPGVQWSPEKRKWRAKIGVNRRGRHLGYFNSLSEAIAARVAAEQQYFPGIRTAEGGGSGA
ncbi:MAG: hypothetical protein QME79_15130 [Bacillota bacterium]|nr:hypothetical protein [Bacillota bacterium]